MKQAAAKDDSAWLCPQTHSLKSPGGPLLQTLAGHTSWVEEAVVSPDGRRAISTSMDDQRVWDLKSGMELNVQTERAHILYVSWQEGLVWASDRNGKIKIRELDTGSVRFTLAEHYQRVNALAFTPDKQRALTCSYDGTVKVWETTNWQLIASLEGHSAGVTSLVVTPDGKFAVSGGDEPDNSLVVWDLVNYRAHKTLSGHTGKIVNCVFTPDGQRMISTSENEYIVWELPGFRKLYDHEGFGLLSPDGRYLLSQPDVRTIDVSLAENGERVFCTEYAEKRMDSIKVTSDSRYVVIGMSAGIIGSTYVLNINDGEEVTDFWGKFLALAPDDKSVIVVGDRFVLQLINLQSGKVINTFAGHTSRLTSATFTDEGRKLVSTCTDQTLKVWDVARKGESIEIAGHAYWINAISVHGRRAITGCRDGSFKLWNLDTTEVDFSQQYDARGVDAIQWSADGRRTAIVYSDDIRIWDMNKREVVFTLNAASAMNLGIRSFRMSPDGRRAISHVDCMLHTELVAWDLEKGSVNYPFQAGDGSIRRDCHLSRRQVGSGRCLPLHPALEPGERHLPKNGGARSLHYCHHLLPRRAPACQRGRGRFHQNSHRSDSKPARLPFRSHRQGE